MTHEAASIRTKGVKRGLEKRKSPAEITASSIYAACREKGVPTTLDDVAAASGVGRDKIARDYRLLVTGLGLKIPVVGPAEYVKKVAARARVDASVQEKALEILSAAQDAGIAAGRDPAGVAASAIYLASALEGRMLTQGDAAWAAGVTEVTIRNQIKRLRTVLSA